MAHLISYVKKRYSREAAREKRAKMGILSREVIPRSSWRWYKHCEFLQSRQSKTPKYLQPAKDSDCLKNTTNDMEEDVELPSPLSPRSSGDEANEPESMQAEEIDYMEDENQSETISESIQYQMDTKSDDFEEAEDSSSIQNIDESTEHEDAPESKESCEQDDDGTVIYEDSRKFLISGICSTITHHLSNADYTDDDIVDFHGDLLMYLYKTIHKT
uniref:Uncharacterized protein n=1 Tax=Lutzomyia longipalpis TaxID=7200 RepID=A0A1B0GH09_LUTLO